ncbi:MAG: type 4a pilus biogenesis protein PilO [Gemmatimonadaceae bacterium]
MALLPKGQREQTLVFIGVLAFVAVGAYWNFVYSPRAAELHLKREQIDTIISLNQKAKSELAKGNLGQLRAQLAEYQQNLALVRTLVPTSNEVPALLEQVSTAARRVGLDLAAVDPQPITEGVDYDTHRYNIAVVGAYHDLAEFLTNVGALTRVVLPVNLTLQQPSNPAAARTRQKREQSVIEARFQLQTYVTRKAPAEEEEPPRNSAGEE